MKTYWENLNDDVFLTMYMTYIYKKTQSLKILDILSKIKLLYRVVLFLWFFRFFFAYQNSLLWEVYPFDCFYTINCSYNFRYKHVMVMTTGI